MSLSVWMMDRPYVYAPLMISAVHHNGIVVATNRLANEWFWVISVCNTHLKVTGKKNTLNITESQQAVQAVAPDSRIVLLLCFFKTFNLLSI